MVKVAGDDARKFLNGLLTTDIDKVTPEQRRLCARCSPRRARSSSTSSWPRRRPPTAAASFSIARARSRRRWSQRLNFYKLRAKVIVEDLSEALGVLAMWDGAGETEYGLCYRRPAPAGARRALHAAAASRRRGGGRSRRAAGRARGYEAHRIALGVPRGGLDFIYGDAFPHEADMDQLGGVDFDKGCYVGQEVVSRIEHRGTARKRVVPVDLRRIRARGRHAGDGGRQEPSARWARRPAAAGLPCCGSTGSRMRSRPARRSIAGGIAIRLVKPAWARFALPGEPRPRNERAHSSTPTACTAAPGRRHDPLYVAYHDEEWGVPEYDDRALYEKLVLDGFQAGLSWITILRKRENFRRAFDGFEPEKIARYTPKKVEQLMQDAGIVRNRMKIEGTVLSARAWLDIMEKGPGFSTLLWDFIDGKPKVNRFRSTKQVPAETAVSRAMSKELAGRGFKFVGPTIVYAFMQAVGMVNDHLVTCHRHAGLRAASRGR